MRPEFLADLCLGAFLDEPHVQDAPVLLVEVRDERGERVEVLDEFQGGIFHADECGEGRVALVAVAVAVAVAVDGGIEGCGGVGVRRDLDLDDFLLGQVHQRGRLRDGG